MLASDIKGAKPRIEIPKEVSRKLFFDNKDIEFAQPRALHVGLNKDYNSMNTSDIPGSKPKLLKF